MKTDPKRATRQALLAAKASRSARQRRRRVWRKKLYKKTFSVQAWDWKADPRWFLSEMCETFALSPSFTKLDPERPERWLATLARKHRLRVYDLPSIEGSDIYGFILAKERLNRREIQQIEADYWGETFDTVYK
jgi:hypothetical protein